MPEATAAPPRAPLTAEQQALVERNAPLARWAASKVHRSGPLYRRADFDDLVGAAIEGLCEAARRFDPARGFKFATYAAWYCRGYAQRAALHGGVVSLPVTVTRCPKRCSPQWWEAVRLAGRAAAALEDRRYQTPDVGEADGGEQILAPLDARSRQVMRMRIVDGMTLDETGRALGVCKERVRQIEQKALARLRKLTPRPGG